VRRPPVAPSMSRIRPLHSRLAETGVHIVEPSIALAHDPTEIWVGQEGRQRKQLGSLLGERLPRLVRPRWLPSWRGARRWMGSITPASADCERLATRAPDDRNGRSARATPSPVATSAFSQYRSLAARGLDSDVACGYHAPRRSDACLRRGAADHVSRVPAGARSRLFPPRVGWRRTGARKRASALTAPEEGSRSCSRRRRTRVQRARRRARTASPAMSRRGSSGVCPCASRVGAPSAEPRNWTRGFASIT
jgi:hypothetical protein